MKYEYELKGILMLITVFIIMPLILPILTWIVLSPQTFWERTAIFIIGVVEFIVAETFIITTLR